MLVINQLVFIKTIQEVLNAKVLFLSLDNIVVNDEQLWRLLCCSRMVGRCFNTIFNRKRVHAFALDDLSLPTEEVLRIVLIRYLGIVI